MAVSKDKAVISDELIDGIVVGERERFKMDVSATESSRFDRERFKLDVSASESSQYDRKRYKDSSSNGFHRRTWQSS